VRSAWAWASVAVSVLIVLPLGCTPEPRLDVRLDGTWLFRPDPEQVGIAQQWYAPEFPRLEWTQVVLPSTWETSPGLRAYDGWGWYTRMIESLLRWGRRRCSRVD
jgi:hypothetical protein